MSVETLHPRKSSGASQRVRISLRVNKMDGWNSCVLKYQQQHKNMIFWFFFFPRLLICCCQMTVQCDERYIYSQLSCLTRDTHELTSMFTNSPRLWVLTRHGLLCNSGMLMSLIRFPLWCHWMLVCEQLSGLGKITRASLNILVSCFLVFPILC